MNTLADRKVSWEKIGRTETDYVPSAQKKARTEHELQLRLREQAELVQARFGLLYSGFDLHEIIRHHLPFRLWRRRSTMWWAADFDDSRTFAWPTDLWRETNNQHVSAGLSLPPYLRLMPDKALDRWSEAKKENVFTAFAVVEPAYLERPRVNQDPWLLGQFDGQFVVLAYWD